MKINYIQDIDKVKEENINLKGKIEKIQEDMIHEFDKLKQENLALNIKVGLIQNEVHVMNPTKEFSRIKIFD